MLALLQHRNKGVSEHVCQHCWRWMVKAYAFIYDLTVHHYGRYFFLKLLHMLVFVTFNY